MMAKGQDHKRNAMAIHNHLHRSSFHLSTLVVICQALLASQATAFGSLATLQVSCRGFGDTTRYRNAGIHRQLGGGGHVHVLTVSSGSRPSRGSVTALDAVASRRASAIALKKVTTRYLWWQPIWTRMTAVGNVILGELQRLSWKQRMLMLTVFLMGISIGRSLSTLTLTRFRNVDDIPPAFFGPSAPFLKGRAVSVSDGDTFRFYHTPTYFQQSTLDKKKQRLLDHTLLVRLCAIDTPETAKSGKPAQPFAEQAKQELQRLIEDRTVRVRLLTKDQYGRAVGQVIVSPPPRSPLGKFLRKKLDVEDVMLQAGLAEVYQGMGAVYGRKGKDYYLKLESIAQQSKKGMWALSKRESAADYKRRTKKDK